MRNKDLRLVVDTFCYYYKSVTKNDSYRFKMTDNKKVMILNFIDDFKEQSGSTFVQEDYLRQFMEWQFNYWYRRDAKYGQGTSIQLEWIIGKKAQKRWEERTEKQKEASSYIVRKGLKKDVKLKRTKKYNEGWAATMTEVKQREEVDKEAYFNTAKGYVNCLINTTLYNHKSKLCLKCKFSSKCKRELAEQYPNVYKIRGY